MKKESEIRLMEIAKNIKALVLDGDGVVFTGHVLEGSDGPIAKIRSHADGQGISLLRASGLKIACVSGESGMPAAFLERLVEKGNNLPSVKGGRWSPVALFTGAERMGKVKIIEQWLKKNNLSLFEC